MFSYPRKRGGDIPPEAIAVGELPDDSAQRFVLSHVRNANLQRQGNTESSAEDRRVTRNEDFWRPILASSHRAFRWVELIDFQLTDWFPRTPGLYHTIDAIGSRRDAESYKSIVDGIAIYKPAGKTHMIEGGIGSVRFKPIQVRNEEHLLCTATSDGYCHTGIPLAVPARLLEEIDYRFDYQYKITGEVKYLPEFLENHFWHMNRIPQIYILVDAITRLRQNRSSTVRITPVVFFTASQGNPIDLSVEHEWPRYQRRRESNQIDYVTYVTCDSHTTSELDTAAEWLEWYVSQYGDRIVTNYDQQRPTFQNAPFSLQNIMNGKLDPRELRRFHIERAEIISNQIGEIHAEVATVTEIKVTLGDGTIVTGDVVAAMSIKDSFNRVASADIPDDLKSHLAQLTKAVGVMNPALPKETSEQVAQDLQTLIKEATRKNPRTQWWQLSIDAIKNVAISVGELGKPVVEALSVIATLLGVK